jgi:16S rRNA (cytidine1402-2'-O)-methyltransferase
MVEARGTLWVVATPIGNLDDLAPRAVAVLKRVAVIAAEDTRHSQVLLSRFAIGTPAVAYHEHNEREMSARLVARLLAGDDVALVSDAGTPTLSDPGYRLVHAARAAGVRTSPVPGPSALVAALSASGLPSDRFAFEGFLPARRAVLARELTKVHETVLDGTLAELAARVAGDADQRLGELVLVVAGAEGADEDARRQRDGERVFALLARELPAGKAAKLAAAITGAKRNGLYRAGGED